MTPSSLWLQTAPAIPTDAFDADARYDIVIAGAGLTGLATAVLLGRAGKRVAVLEARTVGAVTTGNTTGKVSLLQGTTLSAVRRYSSDRVLGAYVDANVAGRGWLLNTLDQAGVPYELRDAYTHVTTREALPALAEEFDAARCAGLPVARTQDTGLPFATAGALRLPDQAQVHPMRVLAALAAELRSLGGRIVEGERVTAVSTGRPVVVTSTSGRTRADAVVLATGTPVVDRGLTFAKTEPHRSYVAAFRVPGPLPDGMHLSADAPTRSLRTAIGEDGEELLLVGGNGHPAGHAASPAELLADLAAWTERAFPGAERTHWWAAQDYRSVNRVPFVGWLPRGRGRIFLATGYDKWGMTNAVAAALSLTADLTGEEPPEWARILHHRVTRPVDLADGVRVNATAAATAARTWSRTRLRPRLSDEVPAEGTGVVGRRGHRAAAVSTVAGRTCELSAICPHLGGLVRWNDAELSWDCPLHGSRFAADGSVLEGPATRGLRRLGDA